MIKKNAAKLPTVVIVGRINVGKSTLFNRLTETQKALVSKIPGTTRDYNFGRVDWRRKQFNIIDTGGVNIDVLKHSIKSLLPGYKANKNLKFSSIEKEIVDQTKEALNQANLILMVVDGRAGLLPEDKELALVLKKTSLPILLVCNKIDNQKYALNVNEFYQLGLGQPNPLSAANGSGAGDLLDIVVKKLKWPIGRPAKILKEKSIKVALIGKPNAGKSSLVNRILGEKRVIVSPIPQTTREPQDTEIIYQNQKITLIDTAGLRRKSKVRPGLERMATKRTLQMIKKSDVILLITEVNEPLTKQDGKIAGVIKDSQSGLIIISNKWDILEDKTQDIDSKVRRYYQVNFPYLSFAPLLFTSALTGRNVEKILNLVIDVWKERNKEIPEAKLAEAMSQATGQHRPVKAKGPYRPRISSVRQTGSNPPEFTVTVGAKQSIHFSYIRYLENRIRDKFSFTGVPIRIKVVSKRD